MSLKINTNSLTKKMCKKTQNYTINGIVWKESQQCEEVSSLDSNVKTVIITGPQASGLLSLSFM